MVEKSKTSKKSIRQFIHLKRKALSFSIQQQKSIAIMRQLIKDPLYLRAHKIAAYYPHQNEVDPQFILLDAWKKNKHCYLPILHPSLLQQLHFKEYCKDDLLKKNRYGIPEPILNHRKIIPSTSLDLVLIPLVAFDETGMRLGSGKGYYDRTFTFLSDQVSTTSIHKKPVLLGLAYDFQQVQSLPKESHDILLSGVVTETQLHWFNK